MWNIKHVVLLLFSILICGVSAFNSELFESLNSSNLTIEKRDEILSKLDKDQSFEALKFSGNFYFFGNEMLVPNYEKSLKKYESAYELDQSDSEVIFMIGLMYNYGVGCELDATKGLMFMVASVRLGNHVAHAAIGHTLYYGLGIKKNCDSSRVYLYRAARNCLKEMSPKDTLSIKKPERLSTKSIDQEKVRSQLEAVEYYEYSAKGGDKDASLLLGQLYYFGTEGSDPDYEKAKYHFENAVSLGVESAYAFLGQMYYRGEGVSVDFEKSYSYFLKAAENNVPAALNGLGLMYWRGQVVEKNLDLAESYLKQAADLKYPEAYYNYALVLLEQPEVFTTEQVFQNLLAATKLGYVFANVEIVKRYLKSDNSCNTSITFLKQTLDKGPSKKLFKEAHQLYKKELEDQALSRYIYLAAQGYEIANFNAGFILEKTKNAKHMKRAAFFYSRSAKMGNAEARKRLGDVYLKIGDSAAAVAQYLLSANSEKPDPEALFNLGYALETGNGLKMDLWSAIDMYNVSLVHGKSGKLAVSLAIAKCRAKLFLSNFSNYKSMESKKSKQQRRSSKRKDTDKLYYMLATLILTAIIYYYINYYQTEQQRQRQQQQLHLQRQNQVDSFIENINIISPAQSNEGPPSIHSDSSSSPTEVASVTEFRFRRNPVHELKHITVADDEDEVD